jgi:hypothetical protein
MANTTTNTSDIPALPVLRARQANTSPTDAVNTEPTVLEVALPPIRIPARRINGEEAPAPLPTLRTARAATPDAFEPEDEDSFVIRRKNTLLHINPH